MSQECWKRFETALANCNRRSKSIEERFEGDAGTQISLMASLLLSLGATLQDKSGKQRQRIKEAMQSMSEAICSLQEAIDQELTKEGEECDNAEGIMNVEVGGGEEMNQQPDEEMEEKECPLFEEIPVDSIKTEVKEEPMEELANEFLTHSNPLIDHDYALEMMEEQPGPQPLLGSSAPVLYTNVLTPHMVPDGSECRQSTVARSTADEKRDALLLQCVSRTFILRPCFLCDLLTDKYLIVPHVNRRTFLLALEVKNEKEKRKVEMMKGSHRHLYLCVHHMIEREESESKDENEQNKAAMQINLQAVLPPQYTDPQPVDQLASTKNAFDIMARATFLTHNWRNRPRIGNSSVPLLKYDESIPSIAVNGKGLDVGGRSSSRK